MNALQVVERIQQLFVLALQQGNKKPEDWAGFVAQILAAQGQKIIKDGKPIETAEAQWTELIAQANYVALK